MRRFTRDLPGAEIASRLSLDSLSFFLIIASMIISFFIFTQSVSQDLNLAIKAAFVPTFAMSGLLMRPIFTGTWSFRPLTGGGIAMALAGGGIALAVLAASASLSPMSNIAVDSRLFYVNMAIVEEVFFNYFMFAYICTIYPWPVAALLTGLFFAPFHLGVYGVNLAFMVYAVAARVVLCTVYYTTGALSSAIIAHMIFNLIAVGSVIAP